MRAEGRGDAGAQCQATPCQPGTLISGAVLAGTGRIQPGKMLAVAGSLPGVGTLPSTPWLPARVTPFVPSPCHWPPRGATDLGAREELG